MTAIILPDYKFNQDNYERIKDVLIKKFNDRIVLFALDVSKNLYKEFNVHLLSTNEKHLFLSKEVLISLIDKYSLNRIVIMRRGDDTNPNIQWEKINFPFYRDINGGESGIRPVDNSHLYEKERNTHKIFSRSTTDTILNDTRMQLFPYTYLQEVNDVSKIDQFGFRLNDEVNKNKKLIILLSGSGGHDLNATDDETITAQLKDLLPDEYQLLNYSLPGFVFLNEMILYLLIIKKLNPFMVIAYDGVNDFLNGIQNDEILVKKYNLNYTHYLEKIASKLYNKESKHNCPNMEDIAKSYIERKKQFDELLRNDNIKFISVLQPLVYSKSKISEKEKKLQKKDFLSIYERIPQGYNYLDNIEVQHYLNLHKIFNKFDDKDTLFVDSIYQLPLANKYIAQEIAEFLKHRKLI